MIPWIDEISPEFPSVDHALDEPDGLLCAGGNLEAGTLLIAYINGIFPWYSSQDPILWWSPLERCTLIPSEVHESRSLKRFTKKHRFKITTDRCFRAVMAACAAPRRGSTGTWITSEMTEAYCHLAKLGTAHSVELFDNHQLVGGLYGLAIGQIFFAESMFSSTPNASKILLVWLCRRLDEAGYVLMDCQVENPHLTSMGAKIIKRPDYLNVIAQSCATQVKQDIWQRNE